MKRKQKLRHPKKVHRKCFREISTLFPRYYRVKDLANIRTFEPQILAKFFENNFYHNLKQFPYLGCQSKACCEVCQQLQMIKLFTGGHCPLLGEIETKRIGTF